MVFRLPGAIGTAEAALAAERLQLRFAADAMAPTPGLQGLLTLLFGKGDGLHRSGEDLAAQQRNEQVVLAEAAPELIGGGMDTSLSAIC